MKQSVKKELSPWLDLRLTEEAITYLWDIINHPVSTEDARNKLAGNISKSTYIQDKDDWFYENVLKQCAESLYFRKWANYYNVHIQSSPPPEFSLETMWVNYQKQTEFQPLHRHSGQYSFVVFMKIPTHWEHQHALPISSNSNMPSASDFQIVWTKKHEDECITTNFPLSSEDEGVILFFPAEFLHQVFPFYGTEEERITVSGNIVDGELKLLQ